MFQIFASQPVSSAGMFLGFVLSMGILLFLAVQYEYFIQDAENMSITKRKELKAMKTKFLNSYGTEAADEEKKEVRKEQINVEVFVDKAVSRLTFAGLRPKSWRFFAGQSIFMSILFAGFGIFNSFLQGNTLRDIIPFYVAAFLELYIYFSIVSICDYEGREKILRLTILEYIENHMLNRIRIAEAFKAEQENVKHIEPQQDKKEVFSEEQEKELDELLQEFLF